MAITFSAFNNTTFQPLSLDEFDLNFLYQTAYDFTPGSSPLFGAPEVDSGTENQFSITLDLGEVNGQSQTVQAVFTGDWPAPLSFNDLLNFQNQVDWLNAAGGIEIGSLFITSNVGEGYTATIDFDGQGPTVIELVTTWTEQSLVDVLPVQPLNWTGDDGDNLKGGTEGDDVMFGLGGRDKLKGKAGDDTIDGGEGIDNLKGGKGADVIYGGDGEFRDLIFGGNQADSIDGGLGGDMIRGGAGNDVIYGNSTNPILPDFAGDELNGGKGADFIYGSRGDDTINGGNGNDSLLGGVFGDDTFIGSKGNDSVYGGFGVDTFIYTSGKIGGTDTILIDAGQDIILLDGFGLTEGATIFDFPSDRITATAGSDFDTWFLDIDGEKTLELRIDTGSVTNANGIYAMIDFL